jgi:hypothetical protein
LVEINDTPGSESVSLAHRSGTYAEVAPDGDKTVRVVGNDYEIIAKNKNVMVDGNMNIVIADSVIEDITGNKTENVSSLEINSTNETTINSGMVKISAANVVIDGNLTVDGVVQVGLTTIGSRNVTAATFSSPAAIGAILSEPVNLGVMTGVNVATTASTGFANTLSDAISVIRTFESELQALEDDLERWVDLETELTAEFEGLKAQYGIE